MYGYSLLNYRTYTVYTYKYMVLAHPTGAVSHAFCVQHSSVVHLPSDD